MNTYAAQQLALTLRHLAFEEMQNQLRGMEFAVLVDEIADTIARNLEEDEEGNAAEVGTEGGAEDEADGRPFRVGDQHG
ncbi:MAG: hypothetical protein H6953_11685 [Chromatiaceae bacterium]|nr:hypothetical protein [Chromatiaceae bacterium]MCP5315992.1 hypothetical protein [Chromatiaceae bacterium]